MWALLASAVWGLASPGCAGPTLEPGRRQEQVVNVPGASPFTEDRSVMVTVPPAGGPVPVLFAFHGYGNSKEQIANEHRFDELADREGFAVVYVQGMADGKNGPSWNLGPQGDQTCDRPAYSECYASCKALGACGACSWHTCADDFAFVDALIAQLGTTACIDTDRLYLYGESAGAMLVYQLLDKRPGVFAAAVPEQGLPYRGQAVATTTPILHLHDRQDTTVPLAGGRAEDGWLYAPLSSTLQGLCGGLSRTPYESNLPKVQCSEYTGCASTVVQCLYDGVHGDLPDGTARRAGLSDDFIWGFVSKFSTAAAPAPVGSGWRRAWLGVMLAGVFLAAGGVVAQRRGSKDESRALLQ